MRLLKKLNIPQYKYPARRATPQRRPCVLTFSTNVHSGAYANICTRRMLWQAFPVKPRSAGRKKEGTSNLGYSASTRRANEATLSLQQKTLGFLVIQGSRLGFLRPTLARVPTVRFPIPEASVFFLFASYDVYHINLYLRCEPALCQHRTGIYTSLPSHSVLFHWPSLKGLT